MNSIREVSMGYYVDLETIALEELFSKLQEVSVLPSQKVLREAPEERCLCLQKCGIHNLRELEAALKSKDRIAALSTKTGLTLDYLTLMRRELDRYHPRAIVFSEIPGLKEHVLERLKQNNIRNTMHLFDMVITAENRQHLADRTGITLEEVDELTRLTDVSRIMWTTPAFARLTVEAGYDCVEKIADADYRVMYGRLAAVNSEKSYYRGRLTERDIWLFIRYARDVPQIINW
jgi:hypothetical protein